MSHAVRRRITSAAARNGPAPRATVERVGLLSPDVRCCGLSEDAVSLVESTNEQDRSSQT